MKLALLAATAVTAAGALAPAASSHSIVLPFSSRPADLQLYTLVVPTEADSPTTEVALKVPEGIDFMLVKEAPGWQVKIERRNDRIDVVRWTGSAPPDSFAEFGLIARNPILEGDLPWRITQTYGNGDVVRWIGPPGSEFPASVTKLSEAADPVDVATGLNGGDVPTSSGTSEASGTTGGRRRRFERHDCTHGRGSGTPARPRRRGGVADRTPSRRRDGGKGGMMLRRLSLLGVLAAALAAAPNAFADAGSPNYSSKLISVAPSVKGLTVRVVDGDDAIELRNATGLNVVVPGYENEPYLRFLVNGRVEVNVNSPAKYLNEERYGGVSVPKTASAKAKPRWQLISQGGAYTWHEHRVHWMSTNRPPKVEASDGSKLEKVFDWVVPMSVGGERVKASGTLWWVPTGQLAQADALIAAATAKEAQEAKAAAQRPAQTEEEPAPAVETTAAPLTPTPAEATSDSGSPVLWIVIALLALALAAAGAYVIKLRRGDEPGRTAGEVW